MTKFLLGVVALSLMLGGFASLVVSIYFFHRTLREVKPGKKIAMRLLAPLALALPHFWTEKGNQARVRSMVWMAIFLVCFGGVAAIVTITAP